MTGHEKDLLFDVSRRLRSEAIRREHESAEAFIRQDWFAVSQHWRAFTELHAQADAVASAMTSTERRSP